MDLPTYEMLVSPTATEGDIIAALVNAGLLQDPSRVRLDRCLEDGTLKKIGPGDVIRVYIL